MPRIGLGLGLGQFGLSGGSAYDADAQAFFDRVTTAGGSLSTTEKSATNQLVLDLKSYSIWTKMKAIYPMVGASAAACSQNLVSSSFTGTFNGGWTYASTGVTPNGTNGYFDTGLQMQQLSNTTNHLSAYMRSATANNKSLLGAFSGGTQYTILGNDMVNPYYVSYNSLFLTFVNVPKTGLLFGTYISGTEKLFRNGTLQKSTTITNTSTTSTRTFYIGAYNNNGTAQQFINQEIAFNSLGDGLTDTEASDLYTAVQNMQVSLSRNV